MKTLLEGLFTIDDTADGRDIGEVVVLVIGKSYVRNVKP